MTYAEHQRIHGPKPAGLSDREWQERNTRRRELRKIAKLDREWDQAHGIVKQHTEKPQVDVGTDPWADWDGAA